MERTSAPSATSQHGFRHSARGTTRKSRVSAVIVSTIAPSEMKAMPKWLPKNSTP